MSVTPAPVSAASSKHWRRARRCLVGLAVFLTLIVTFYTEESWRGKRAWEECKGAMAAKGIRMDWADHIPAPVPDRENVFGVPEMQKWFVGRGATELSRKIEATLNSNPPPVRLVLADVVVGQPGVVPASGFTVLSYGGADSKAEASRLINEALGPTVRDPRDLIHMVRRPGDIQPAKIVLLGQPALTTKELEQFLPSPLISGWGWAGNEKAQVQPASNGSYQVTILAPSTTADYLAAGAGLEADFNVIREALRRPYTQMKGGYQNSWEIPIPNFVTIRAFAQRLAATAQCHLLKGQPEEALRDLTFMRDLWRILESQPSGKPMTLVAAMIHVAVTGVYASVIADGLDWRAWREPQLTALQEQLKETNPLPDLRHSFEDELAADCQLVEKVSPTRMGELFGPPRTNGLAKLAATLGGDLIPRGWDFQNLVRIAGLEQTIIGNMDPGDQRVFPKKVEAAYQTAQSASSHKSPSTFRLKWVIPNWSQAIRTAAQNQTLVRQALIACALERYRLAHNSYPDSLAALVPQFLAEIPADLIGGQPLHYRRTNDGKFILYSVGWNETDDGGKPGPEGDWVWDDHSR